MDDVYRIDQGHIFVFSHSYKKVDMTTRRFLYSYYFWDQCRQSDFFSDSNYQRYLYQNSSYSLDTQSVIYVDLSVGTNYYILRPHIWNSTPSNPSEGSDSYSFALFVEKAVKGFEKKPPPPPPHPGIPWSAPGLGAWFLCSWLAHGNVRQERTRTDQLRLRKVKTATYNFEIWFLLSLKLLKAIR